MKVPETQLGVASLPAIKRMLDARFGIGEWKDYELETISLDLDIVLDELLRDKICVLQIQEEAPITFWENPLFFVYASDVINNKVADFETFVLPTSLELGYAIHVMHEMCPIEPSYNVKAVIKYVLQEEGYTSPVAPLDFKGITLTNSEEAKKEDMTMKETAMQLYIKGMDQNGGI